MTIISDVEAHSRAVAAFQALLSKHRPGSSPYCIAERALDLAFNSASARGTAPEQELLAEAKSLIELQVRSKLIAEPSADKNPPAPRSFERHPIRSGYLAWRGMLHPHAAERFVQTELWLTTAEQRSGDAHGLIC
ncbi:hypothetical protein [Variovorax saccharolyticus]|uniref:hypothetical protein n=1 Tax=Variovorax saccharolyticus TaxID=3053516 RepID=UPI0025756BD2|nr:hypothetical protein [Variovorax sp. J22R187]MDM0018009.1 hypothetical protein [Variovorax sp. J22R187]